MSSKIKLLLYNERAIMSMKLYLRQQKKKKLQENGENAEDGGANDDARVGVIDTATGRTLTGDEAPLMSQLSAFLEAHPGWEPIESESEDDDDDDDEDEDKSDSKFFILGNFCTHLFSPT